MKTFGELSYNAATNRFLVNCEPHVSLRLKRVFGKLGVQSMGTHSFHASPENARDLLWFAERYPLELNNGALEKVTVLANEHKATEEYIHKFYQGGSTSLPFDLALPAREYQKQAADLWLKVKGLLLADDVGLGKTVSGIAGLTGPNTLPAIVVTLAHLPKQWQREINRFAPHLRAHIAKQGTPYKIDDMFGKPDVLIINYHKLAGWAETLAGWAQSIIFDEIQELRRSDSNKYAAAEHIARSTEYRLGLSATPIFNYGGEFFNVIEILQPGVLGAPEEFHREWCSWGFSGKERIKEPKAFGRYITDAGIMLRRTRKEVAREIPPISKFHQTIDADTAALDQVSRSCAELAEYLLRGQQVNKGDKMRASEELSNILRQATGIAKAPHVANFVKILVENGEKVVLYGWHRAVYDVWNDMLAPFNPVMFTGSESAKQKDENKEKFVNGDSQVLIISLRAGAGLDGLQYACKTVVFGELDWSPGVHEQAIGRVARDGQEDPVMAYFLVAESGSDPVMVDVLGIKKGQIEGVRNHNAALFEKLQTDPNHVKKLAENFLAQQGKG
jgi:SNF2 family DNA or RNA helicase